MISDNLDKIVSDNREVFLLDLSWHLHRNWHSFKWMTAGTNGMGRPTGHIYGILYTIQTIKERYPNAVIFLCKDGVPVERIKMYQEQDMDYKEGRPELEFDFFKDIDVISALSFMVPDVYMAFDPYRESDDIMYALAKQVEKIANTKIFVYSGDDDLLQAISEKTCVIRKVDGGSFEEINNDFITSDERMVKKFAGVDSKHLPFYRCIIGDKSDKMPGIPRFPKALAARIAMASESLEDVFTYNQIKTKSEQKYLDLLQGEYRPKIELNYRMMKLPEDINVSISRKSVNEQAVSKIISSYKLTRFRSFLNNYNKTIWVETLQEGLK